MFRDLIDAYLTEKITKGDPEFRLVKWAIKSI